MVQIILYNVELALLPPSKKKKSPQLAHFDDNRKSVLRPDILHQSLLMLLDSPIATKFEILLYNFDGRIFAIDPEFRIPRTWKVFAKVMGDFLSQNELKTPETEQVLIKVLEPPLSRYLRQGSVPICFVSHEEGGQFCRLRNLIPRLYTELSGPPTFLINLSPTIKEESELAGDIKGVYTLTVSHYPIAKHIIVARLCEELEHHFST